MTVSQAIQHAYNLQREWIGQSSLVAGQGYDLARIHASMLQEYRWNRSNPCRCTIACAKETRGKLVLLGKVRKVLAEVSK